MHNGNGHRMGHGPGNGSGKRWLLIALLVLGGFWLLNDAYSDGFRDALVQTGQAGNGRYYRGGPDFPWGLVIVGGIAFVAYRKGAFDRFTGPGGAFGPGAGGYGVQRYGGGGNVPPAGPAFRGPRSFFDDWHRQAHEAAQGQQPQQPAGQPASAGPYSAATGNGQGHDHGHGQDTSMNYGAQPHYQAPQAPAPTPPAPEYWTTLGGPAANGGAATSAPTAPGETRPGESASGASGATTERW